MMVFSKKFFALQIFFVLFSSLFLKSVDAQVQTAGSTNPGTGPDTGLCEIRDGVSIYPCSVTEDDPTVKIRFLGIDATDSDGGNIQYYVCRLADQQTCKNDKDFNKISLGALGSYETVVCGDGPDKLKGDFNGKNCSSDGSDWFHQGQVYSLGVYTDRKPSALVTYANFYIGHFFPQVSVSPQNPKKDQSITVTLTGRAKGDDKQNNYQVLLKGRQSDYEEKGCLTVSGSGNSASGNFSFPNTEKDGSYLLIVKDQVNEKNECDGGDFTYYHVPIRVGCESYDKKCVGIGTIGHTDPNDPIYKDPNGVERREELSDQFVPTPICEEYDSFGNCLSVNTALGSIGVSPEGFIADIFKIVLSATGIIATIIFLIAGYRLLTSRGDKERIAQSRDQITAAILGIIFIVLSFVLLEIIGVDILVLPGFLR